MSKDQRDIATRAFFPDGEEPDPRFTLANERTFLAWMRTSLAFLAGGIALEAFPLPNMPEVARTWLAVGVLAIGMIIAGGAVVRWVRIERAMRHHRPLPAPTIAPLLAAAALVAAAGVITLIVIQ